LCNNTAAEAAAATLASPRSGSTPSIRILSVPAAVAIVSAAPISCVESRTRPSGNVATKRVPSTTMDAVCGGSAAAFVANLSAVDAR